MSEWVQGEGQLYTYETVINRLNQCESELRAAEALNERLAKDYESLSEECQYAKSQSIAELCRALKDLECRAPAYPENAYCAIFFGDGSGNVENWRSDRTILMWRSAEGAIAAIDAACRPEGEPKPEPLPHGWECVKDGESYRRSDGATLKGQPGAWYIATRGRHIYSATDKASDAMKRADAMWPPIPPVSLASFVYDTRGQ